MITYYEVLGSVGGFAKPLKHVIKEGRGGKNRVPVYCEKSAWDAFERAHTGRRCAKISISSFNRASEAQSGPGESDGL